MKCHFCTNPATIHLFDIVEQRKHELHVCEACAVKHQLFSEAKQELNLTAVLQLLMGPPSATAETEELTCPQCGLEYNQFRSIGRLGCHHDYEAFRVALEPLLERIHQRTHHMGKRPMSAARASAAADRETLTRQLRAAIASERYEEAARLRDLIRRKEATDESGQPTAETR